jgi:hypothetical protein
MANPHRGEVEFTVGKKVYTLVYSINAMCELEGALNASVVAIANSMSDPARMGVKTMRTVFWAGLRDHHEALTEADAGRLMDQVGLIDAAQHIVKAFTMAFPSDASAPHPLATAAAPRTSTGKRH